MSVITDILSLENTIATDIFLNKIYPHEVLKHIYDFIKDLGRTLSADSYELISENIWVSKTASVAPSAYIASPCIIDHGAEIRHCAFIRGGVIIGKNCVVGNSCELKNVILFDQSQVPHFNYVGDSILGFKAHMGAGAITSNLKSDKSNVNIDYGEGTFSAECKKIGSIIGDFAEIGCNCVLNPGSVIGKNSNIYPLSSVRGYIPPDHIYKSENKISPKISKT